MILAGRLYVAGPATFYWRALGYGWTWTVVIAWASWMAQRRSVATPDPSRHAIDAPALFTMLSVQVLLFNVAFIDQRERAAGKDGGYSNPQIRAGSRIRVRLKGLEARPAADAAKVPTALAADAAR